jgi:hypothetical protein
MTFENVKHFLSKETGKTTQTPSEQIVALQNVNISPLLMEPNKRRVLRNEVAAKVASLERAA